MLSMHVMSRNGLEGGVKHETWYMIQNFKTSINHGFHSISVNKIGEIGLEKLFGKTVNRKNPYFKKSVYRRISECTRNMITESVFLRLFPYLYMVEPV